MDFVPAEPGEYRSVSILICKQNRCKHMGANGLPPCAGRFCRPQSAIRRSQPPVYHKPSRLPSLCTPTTDTRLPTVIGEAPGHRPPSPARAAVTNTNTVVAGEGRGWGNNELSSGVGIKTPSTTRLESRRTASTWSTARPPSSHAVRASARSKRPRSRTDRRPRGSNVVTFDRAQIMCEP